MSIWVAGVRLQVSGRRITWVGNSQAAVTPWSHTNNSRICKPIQRNHQKLGREIIATIQSLKTIPYSGHHRNTRMAPTSALQLLNSSQAPDLSGSPSPPSGRSHWKEASCPRSQTVQRGEERTTPVKATIQVEYCFHEFMLQNRNGCWIKVACTTYWTSEHKLKTTTAHWAVSNFSAWLHNCCSCVPWFGTPISAQFCCALRTKQEIFPSVALLIR
jgi:hypothetical protein